MSLLKKLSLATIAMFLNLNPVFAQQFNGAVSNPFQLCSLPKPCKHCQPMRAQYEELCSNQNNGNNKPNTDSFSALPNPMKQTNVNISQPQINQPVATVNANTSIKMNADQIRAEIESLKPTWNAQIEVSTASRVVLEKCVAQNGRVQDGFCQAELADFNIKREPAIASRDKIEYLESLLLNSN